MTDRTNALVGVENLLRDNAEKINSSLPAHLAQKPGYIDKFISAILSAISQQPKLLQCSKESFMRAVLKAAELGIDPSGTLGSGYLVPYKQQAVFLVGYRGLIDLARRSADVIDIEAHVVYENDPVFEIEQGLSPVLRHVPLVEGDRGEIIGAYAIARLTEGTAKFEFMRRDEIDKIRSLSKQPAGMAWQDFFAEMCRKTVIRRLMKYLPLSPEVASQINAATEMEDEVFGLDINETKRPPTPGRHSFKEEPIDIEGVENANDN